MKEGETRAKVSNYEQEVTTRQESDAHGCVAARIRPRHREKTAAVPLVRIVVRVAAKLKHGPVSLVASLASETSKGRHLRA